MLTVRQKIYYSMCRTGTTILLNVVFVATFWMYTNQVNLDPVLNGIGNAVGKIVIGISSVVVGIVSDSLSSKSKLGRRKFFIWTGAPALAFSFVMLFTPQFFIPLGSQTTKFVWLLVWNSAFHLFYGYLVIPYQSWMPEITSETERIQVSGLMSTVNLIGSAIGGGFVLVMSGFISEDPQGIYGNAGKYLLIFALLFAVLELLFFLPALLKIKEKKIEVKKKKAWSEIKIALRNRNYMIWVGGFTILNVGVTIMSALILDFVENVIGIVNAKEKFLFAAVMLCVIVLGFLFWGRFAKKFGKKWSLIVAFTWLLIWVPITPLIGKITFISPIVQGYVFGIGTVFGISAVYLFSYAILADFADKDERDTFENRSGLYTGFKSLPFNIAQAIGFITAGFLRGWTKVVGSETINLGLVWLGPICAIFILLSLPIIWKGDFDPFLKDEKVKTTSIFKQMFSKKN
ncbi:MAG: MFS transporter [Candidatus Heimdallarchaeota archaeon]|nr:MAG: MFS transporter [Candidatus Heimdallarchaeota archaeon]